jgi:competence protein ComEC
MVKYIIAYLLVFLLHSVVDHPIWAQQTHYMRIIHLNVGQGDATLVTGPDGTTVMIDAGYASEASKNILPALKAMGVTHLDNIVATHFHSDHIAGFTRLSSMTDASTNIFDRGDCVGEPLCYPVPELANKSGGKTIYAKYKSALLGSFHRVTKSTADIDLGMGAKLKFIGAGGIVWDRKAISGGTPDENAQSVSMLITYGDFKYLICGDVTGGGDGTINLESNIASVVGDINILQSNHHGSPTGNSQEFLEAVSPEIAIISVGNGNSHHLPKRSVLNRFKNLRSTHDFKYLFMTNAGNIGGIELDSGEIVDAGRIDTDNEFIAVAAHHISLFAAPDHYIINGVIMPAGK